MATLYAANSADGAFSETIFHNVPVRGPDRMILVSWLKTIVLSELACKRDLSLVQLHGYGLRRLGLSRDELIEAQPDQYDRTTAWARVLHGWSEKIDGLVWVSRQHDTSHSLVLFGDRVSREDLLVTEVPVPLSPDRGLEMVQRAADQAGITIVLQ